jgi:hypothetical protein
MAASDHLHPQQLAMFMPARDLHKMNSLDRISFESTGAMRHEKRLDNRSGMYHSIAKEGVHNPVQIVHGRDPAWDDYMGAGHDQAVANGNHRVTAAYDINPDMEIPVMHHETADSVFSEMARQDQTKGRRRRR